MSLKFTPISKCLDKKTMIFGYEVPDLLVIFLTLSLLNLVFSAGSLKIPLVWIPTVALAATLRIAKRGKPDNYLVHWIRFQVRPKELSAFSAPTTWQVLPTLKGRKA